jgi:RimJ/RimL family protein N-acetyltransferase
MDAPTLTDGVVTLRIADGRDIPAMTVALTEFETSRWLGTVPHPYAEADTVVWIDEIVPAGWASGIRLTFSIVDSATDAFIGEVGLHHVDGAARRAEVGYWLSPEARGRGAMQRALRLLLGWAFETLGLERVDWSAVADNAASRATAEAVGFRYEGLRRRRLLRTSDGTLHDEVDMGLLRSEWASLTPGVD